jgi:predicted O-methyltransferase YrrM
LKEANLVWKVFPHYMPSSKFFGWLQGAKADMPNMNLQQFDLIFVDGDHSYEGALFDLQAMDPFLKDKGILLVHDTACVTNYNPHPLHYEVSKAIHEWRDHKKYRLVETVDTVMVFCKEPQDEPPNA